MPAPTRIVRRFPPVEVRTRLHDLRSSETVHAIGDEALHTYPVDDLAGVLALQPGVVADAEGIHVRGGRAGETTVTLDGLTLNEPFERYAMDVPLLALRSAELVSGAPEAQYAAGLAGVLDLHTLDPAGRPAAEWRWQSDARTGTHYDRGSLRVSTPLRLFGLGAVAAGDATLDDTSLPALHSEGRRSLLGGSFGWRADNRLLGYVKLAPVERPQRGSAQLLMSRRVLRPYDPAWSLDGWSTPSDTNGVAEFSPDSVPGSVRYRAADHLFTTDEGRLAAIVSVSSLQATRRATLSLGWLHTRRVSSISGGTESSSAIDRPSFALPISADQFHVQFGDYPLYRESGSDAYQLRGDAESSPHPELRLRVGAGLTYESVFLNEIEWLPQINVPGVGIEPSPYDSVRAFRSYAPGGFAYVQSRWQHDGLVLNSGLRLEYFTAGPQRDRQTLPALHSGLWSVSPRLGIAYPLTLRDAFSFAYTRIDQPPARNQLYDSRDTITDRQPLGNPALLPATVISYEASLKHVFDAPWALQASVFLRDIWGQPGARDYRLPGGPTELRYENADEGHALGVEWSVIRSDGESGRFEARYTWLQAWGNETRPEGDPYGAIHELRAPRIEDRPLSWDRRHSLLVAGTWRWRKRVRFAWSSAVDSPLPWTPKPTREPLLDQSAVNSRRLGWSENTDLDVHWSPPYALKLTLGLEARNLFDFRGDRIVSVNGYPNPIINTQYDDYAAYRTETGNGGGAYWSTGGIDGTPHWVPVGDQRLSTPGRTLRASIGASW